MELAVITAKQVAELLLMILAGAVCCKAGVFKPKEKSVLANLLLYLVVPAMVLDSYMVEYDPATFHNLMLAFGLGALVLLVGLGVAFLASFKVQKDARAILWFACAFSNAGYMGFPLIKALFGGEGLPLFALACAVSYMLSGYFGLYSEQKILYSKFRAEFIDRKAH